jgi:hypothetical protein
MRGQLGGNDILAFYDLAYGYPGQVTILGLRPMWMCHNGALERMATARMSIKGLPTRRPGSLLIEPSMPDDSTNYSGPRCLLRRVGRSVMPDEGAVLDSGLRKA